MRAVNRALALRGEEEERERERRGQSEKQGDLFESLSLSLHAKRSESEGETKEGAKPREYFSFFLSSSFCFFSKKQGRRRRLSLDPFLLRLALLPACETDRKRAFSHNARVLLVRRLRHRGRRRRSGGRARLSFLFFIDVDDVDVCSLSVSLRGGTGPLGQAPRRGCVRAEPRRRRNLRRRSTVGAREVEKGRTKKELDALVFDGADGVILSLFFALQPSPHVPPPVELTSQARALAVPRTSQGVEWSQYVERSRPALLIVLT